MRLAFHGAGVLVFFLVGAGVSALAGFATTPGASLDVGSAFAYVNSPGSWIGWLFGAVFAMTAATIVSGAVAERMDFTAYAVIAGAMTALIYPVVQGLTWSGGLLAGSGYIGTALGTGYLDFAGATVVHMVGGLAGLVAAKMVGPRKGRFDANGNSQPIPGHSMIFAVLGTLMLAFGWYGFNVGTAAAPLAEGAAGLERLFVEGLEMGDGILLLRGLGRVHDWLHPFSGEVDIPGVPIIADGIGGASIALAA